MKMNLSDYLSDEKQRMAEWVCEKLNLFRDDSDQYFRRVFPKSCRPNLLASTDSAMKAMEKSGRVVRLQFTPPLEGPTKIIVPMLGDVWVRIDRDQEIHLLFNKYEDTPTAITICIALAMGFKIEMGGR